MKKIWLLIPLVLIAIVYYKSRSTRTVEMEMVPTTEVESNLPMVPVRKIVNFGPGTDSQEPKRETVATPQETKSNQPDPYATDRFSLRKLDLPQPKTVNELRSKLTPFKRPLLPALLPNQEEDGDGDVLTGYRGYFLSDGGELKRLQLDRSSDEIRFSIEDVTGALRTWREKSRDLKIKNFDGDPYSLVLTLPDKRMLYFKFDPRVLIERIEYPVRGMRGWILSKQNGTIQSGPLAVIDYHLPEFENEWPKPDTVKKILPENLPDGKKPEQPK